MKQTPAQYVIAKFGGVCKTARMLGLAPSTVSRWQGDGRIPRAECQQRILAVAKDNGVAIDPAALVVGAEA